ncbi:MAG TPA: DUF5009 domain-containing protein, partial [Clostridia bacterium]|nr:DUF5009 domain-containing protein [Clostridia bacterium]
MSAVTAQIESLRAADSAHDLATRRSRIVSVDALRGLVVFTMIFVNDLAGAPHEIVPAWLRHFEGKSGMTFVDLVFPAFLFIVGMSIPFALGSRLDKGEPVWKAAVHVLVRTLSLLVIGILMVQGSPSSQVMGWSGSLWSVLMFLSALLAFSTVSLPERTDVDEHRMRVLRRIFGVVRGVGFLGLVYLALVYWGENGERIVSFAPFSIRTSWYGILGLIGWSYGVGAMVFLIFRSQRTALLGCMALLLCL